MDQQNKTSRKGENCPKQTKQQDQSGKNCGKNCDEDKKSQQ